MRIGSQPALTVREPPAPSVADVFTKQPSPQALLEPGGMTLLRRSDLAAHLAVLATLPLTLPNTLVCGIEMGARALGAAAFEANPLLGVVAAILLAPLRLLLLLAWLTTTLPARLGGSLARLIAPPDAVERFGPLPIGLAGRSPRELAIPDTWIAAWQADTSGEWWPSIVSELAQLKATDTTRYHRVCRLLETTQTHFFTRFWQVADLEACLGLPNPADPRPIAVMLVARADHNNAFQTTGAIVQDLAGAYQVFYREVSFEDDLPKRLAQLGAKVDNLWIGGHGNGTETALSESGDERVILDVRDDDVFAACSPYLTRNADVTYFSCLSGVGGQRENNMVNATALALPGKRVIGMEGSTQYDAVSLDRFDHMENVRWKGGATYAARVPLRAP